MPPLLTSPHNIIQCDYAKQLFHDIQVTKTEYLIYTHHQLVIVTGNILDLYYPNIIIVNYCQLSTCLCKIILGCNGCLVLYLYGMHWQGLFSIFSLSLPLLWCWLT